MGRILEAIGVNGTQIGSTLAALAAVSGDSLTIRSAQPGSPIYLVDLFADFQAAGVLQVRAPQMHDNQRGFRTSIIASTVQSLFPMGVLQPLFPQEELTVEATGSTTSGDIESAVLQVYYDNVDGLAARLAHSKDVLGNVEHVVSVAQTIETGTGGGWSGAEALDAESDLLKNGVTYALLGCVVSAEACAVGFTGSDFGNVRTAVPCDELHPGMTGRYFLTLSEKTGLPTVPIINYSNKGNIQISVLQDENGTDVLVNSYWAELSAQFKVRM